MEYVGANQNAWFATEIEFKLMAPERQPLVKQARPHSFRPSRDRLRLLRVLSGNPLPIESR